MKRAQEIKSHHIKSIKNALFFIENCFDQPLNLDLLAKIAYLSPYYFHRLFRGYTSISPGDYIKKIRFIQSAKRLQYSHMPITEIAFAVGYESASSFTRAFISQAGISPRDYRNTKKRLLQAKNQNFQKRKPSIPLPEYIYRDEEVVFFLRKTGNYKQTVIEGIKECQTQINTLNMQIHKCYGMAMDDPLTIPREQCRFDVCVVTNVLIPITSNWEQKKLAGGRYAIFTHYGSFMELEGVFTRVFYFWHTRVKEKLRFSGAFCEYLDLIQNNDFSPEKKIVAKYHIPIGG